MTQRVCEKCGAVIEKPTRRNIIGYKPYYLKLHLFKKDEEWDMVETTVELCNDCRDAFDEWLDTKLGETE